MTTRPNSYAPFYAYNPPIPYWNAMSDASVKVLEEYYLGRITKAEVSAADAGRRAGGCQSKHVTGRSWELTAGQLPAPGKMARLGGAGNLYVALYVDSRRHDARS